DQLQSWFEFQILSLQFVDREFRRLLDERRVRREVHGEFLIIIEPPLRARVKNEMGRAAAPEFLQVGDDLRTVERVAVVNAVAEEMPAFAMRVIKNRRIAVGRRDDERVRRSGFVEFKSKIAERGCRRLVEWLDAKIGGCDKG